MDGTDDVTEATIRVDPRDGRVIILASRAEAEWT